MPAEPGLEIFHGAGTPAACNWVFGWEGPGDDSFTAPQVSGDMPKLPPACHRHTFSWSFVFLLLLNLEPYLPTRLRTGTLLSVPYACFHACTYFPTFNTPWVGSCACLALLPGWGLLFFPPALPALPDLVPHADTPGTGL